MDHFCVIIYPINFQNLIDMANKLRNMDRQSFYSPVQELDAIKYNIGVLAEAAGVDWANPSTNIIFKGALGAAPASFTISINEATVPSIDGVAQYIMEQEGDAPAAVEFTATADGYNSITASIVPMGVNMEVILPWVVSAE